MRNQSGFTLIETLVYLALFAILFGGGVTAAYSIAEGSGRDQTKAMVQQEGDFLTAKIDWVLSGTSDISAPVKGSSGSQLSVSKVALDNSNPPIVTVTPITIDNISGNMILIYPSGSFFLNNSNVSISNLNFTHREASGDGQTNPESVTASFTVVAKTQTGSVYTQDFTTTDYLRK
jgi:prepilin-type N-terminal cleavage/methylation domain-containing protein